MTAPNAKGAVMISTIGLCLRLIVLELQLAWRGLFPRRCERDWEFDLAIRRLSRSAAANERRQREQNKWGPS